MEVLRAPCACPGRTCVAELGFSCSWLKNPTLKDKCWVKGRIALLGKIVILGEKLDAHPQEPTSHYGSGGKGFLKPKFQGCGGRGGGRVRSIILKSIVRLPDQQHPDCFGYSSSVTLESVCSRFFEAGSGNCMRWSSLCHGCRLGIV